jgi:hypothetical protein
MMLPIKAIQTKLTSIRYSQNIVSSPFLSPQVIGGFLYKLSSSNVYPRGSDQNETFRLF